MRKQSEESIYIKSLSSEWLLIKTLISLTLFCVEESPPYALEEMLPLQRWRVGSAFQLQMWLELTL